MSNENPRALRDAFGAFLTGITVVTAFDSNNNLLGFTANSFSSVSLEPPLLLVSLAKTSRNYKAFTTASGFAVNILAEDQKEISQVFAMPVADRFAAVKWATGPQGSPVLDEVAAWFDCSMHQVIEAGDHAILIGKVEVFKNGFVNGLGYVRGAYFTPALEEKAMSVITSGTDVVVSAVIERQGEILLVRNEAGDLELPHKSVTTGNGASVQIIALLEETKLQASVGFIYSVYADSDHNKQHIVYHCSAAGGQPSLGQFHILNEQTFTQIRTRPVAEMLKRLRVESLVGDYGIYFGNQKSGEIRQVKLGT